MTPEDLIALRRRYAEVQNKTLVAKEFGLNRKTVRRYCEDPEINDLLESYRRFLESRSPVHPVSRSSNLEGYRRVLFLFDSHHPYHNDRAIEAVLEFARDWKPDLCVLGGDHLDCYAISRFDKDPARAHRLQDEVDALEPTLAAIDRVCRDVVWIDGNHEQRFAKLIGANPSLYGLKGHSIPELLKFPKHWRYCENQHHVKIGDLICLHGDLAGRKTGTAHPAASMLTKLGTNCIFGHQHRISQHSSTGYDGTIATAYACGHLCKPSAMDYIRCPDWQSGFAVATLDRHGHTHVNQLFVLNDSINFNGVEYPSAA